MRQIALDTETTGLEPKEGHRIIEIGCVEIIDRKITNNDYQQFINPEREIEADAMAVHGITMQQLSEKPLFADIANDFMKYIADSELIIHNAEFDLKFLDHELGLLGMPPISGQFKVIDTLVDARKRHPGQRNNLDALCRRYEIDNSHRELHGALIDSDLLANLYLNMTRSQGTLFGGADSKTMQDHNEKIIRLASDRQRTRIIYASKEELALHES